MGYFGLSHYQQSDMASDFVYTVLEAIAEKCEKQLKLKENVYNTDGATNIALFAESFLMDVEYHSDSRIIKVLIKARDQLIEMAKETKESEPWRDKDMHVKAYARMIKNLNKIIDGAW